MRSINNNISDRICKLCRSDLVYIPRGEPISKEWYLKNLLCRDCIQAFKNGDFICEYGECFENAMMWDLRLEDDFIFYCGKHYLFNH